MARALVYIDISDDNELLHLAQEVRAMKEPRVLRHAGEDLAVLAPIKKRQGPRGKATGEEDALWSIVGVGASEGSTDVSENKYKYLADAYAGEEP